MSTGSDISKEDRKYVDVARKYNLRLFRFKLECFILFEEGYKPRQVEFLLREFIRNFYPDLIYPQIREKTSKTVINTIRRYHYEWKKKQKKRSAGKKGER